jgi:mono/diheme cytochrome c family protein
MLNCLLILALNSCGETKEQVPNNRNALSNKEKQYFTNGRVLYESICSSCHMPSGKGLGKLIPPLKNSDYLLNDLPGAAKVIKYGLEGKVIVNGVEYDQPMPANTRLTNLELTELLTYIGNNWGNEHGSVTIAEVNKALKEKKD